MAQSGGGPIIVLGVGALAWYGYTQGWFSSLFSPAAPAAGSSGGSGALSVKIVNNTAGGSASTFRIGDSYTVTVTGPPNSPVTVSGTQNGVAFGPSAQGNTNASGVLTVTGTMPSNNTGPWVENWSVGGVNAGSISFTVSGGSTNSVSNPGQLASLLGTAAGSAAQFGLNIDQWLYYYNTLPGRTPVTGAQVMQMIANSGIPRSQVMDAGSFVDNLNSIGLSGFAGMGNIGYRRIPVPMLVRPAYGKYTTADLRRAGNR